MATTEKHRMADHVRQVLDDELRLAIDHADDGVLGEILDRMVGLLDAVRITPPVPIELAMVKGPRR